MATLSEYFDTEARDRLIELERALVRQPAPEPADVHRAVRGLRGSAQMAREDRVFHAALALEAAARALVTEGLLWDDDVASRVRESVADLRALVDRVEESDALDARLQRSVERWSAVGIVVGAPAPSEPAAGSRSEGEFREFAAREVAGIADALDRGVQQLAAESMDREPLRMILRRQRALLGAARLDELPVVAEILRAVEDLTRVIAKLDIGVKQEWLDIYRVAREGLKATIEPLHRNENPQPSHALSRLRHMREELLERYGTGEAVSAAHESGGLVQAASMSQPPEPVAIPADGAAGTAQDADDALPAASSPASGAVDAVAGVAGRMADVAGQALSAVAGAATAAVTGMGERTEDAPRVESTGDAAHDVAATGDAAHDVAADDDIVPIEDLLYDDDAALARAEELRRILEGVTAHDPQARDALAELFDLLRSRRV